MRMFKSDEFFSYGTSFIISYSKTRNLALKNDKLIISSIYYTLINRFMGMGSAGAGG
jgi:hypothetical protein